MREAKPQYRTLREAIISANIQTGATLRKEWVYEDEDNLEAFRILDYESEDDGRRQVRTVWPVSWDKNGWEEGWCMGMPPGPWPLYRLPEIEPFQRVYICQDEAEADALRSAGLVATAAAHGCYYLNKTDFAPLAGRDVVLVPKFDEAGPVFVRKVTAILARQLPRGSARAGIAGAPGMRGRLAVSAGVPPAVAGGHRGGDRRDGRSAAGVLDAAPFPVGNDPAAGHGGNGSEMALAGADRDGKAQPPVRLHAFGQEPAGHRPGGPGLAGHAVAGSQRVSAARVGRIAELLGQPCRHDPSATEAGRRGPQPDLRPAQPARTLGGRAETTAIAMLHRAIDQANLQITTGQGGTGGTRDFAADDGVKLVLIDPVTWYLSGNANAAWGAFPGQLTT